MTDPKSETRDEKPGEPEDQNFAALFEAYSSGMSEDLRVGDRIKTVILSVEGDSVFVDTGTKSDGIVDTRELLDEQGVFPFKPGDPLELFVIAKSESEVRLSRVLTGVANMELIREAFEARMPVEGKVKEPCKGGLVVELFQRRAFCPISQIDTRFVDKTDDYIGQSYEFLITRFDGGGRNLVVSRRQLLHRIQEEAKKKFMTDLVIGAIVDGIVTRMMPYGAFVELIPGLEGMIHLSEVSWSRAESITSVLKPGDPVKVKVIGIEKAAKPGKKEQLKIGLSLKQTTADPWTTVEEHFKPGDRITGRVTHTADFGAFVEIVPGIEGLVHVSELSHDRIAKVEGFVQSGQVVSVTIKEIDPNRRRLSLSMKDAEGDPWLDIMSRFAVNQVVEGTLERKERFGFFINLGPGITGLLPKSVFKNAERPAEIERLRPGARLNVTIAEILPQERRISLTVGDEPGEKNWQQFLGTSEPSSPGVGTLGSKLLQALKEKKIVATGSRLGIMTSDV